jgi:hypothetical protein
MKWRLSPREDSSTPGGAQSGDCPSPSVGHDPFVGDLARRGSFECHRARSSQSANAVAHALWCEWKNIRYAMNLAAASQQAKCRPSRVLSRSGSRSHVRANSKHWIEGTTLEAPMKTTSRRHLTSDRQRSNIPIRQWTLALATAREKVFHASEAVTVARSSAVAEKTESRPAT